MTETLHANIFFLIASVGVVLFIFLVSIALYHIIKIIRSIRRIVDRIEAGSVTVAEDLSELRETLHPKHLFSLLMNLSGMARPRRRKRTVEDDE